eukprot:scaffold218772_cov33-Tisochrysis_lutea.AAC.3
MYSGGGFGMPTGVGGGFFPVTTSRAFSTERASWRAGRGPGRWSGRGEPSVRMLKCAYLVLPHEEVYAGGARVAVRGRRLDEGGVPVFELLVRMPVERERPGAMARRRAVRCAGTGGGMRSHARGALTWQWSAACPSLSRRRACFEGSAQVIGPAGTSQGRRACTPRPRRSHRRTARRAQQRRSRWCPCCRSADRAGPTAPTKGSMAGRGWCLWSEGQAWIGLAHGGVGARWASGRT